jgi:4-amino-4-deoxy-L-arabinose transferase-like glycosyltransferase
MLCIPALLLAAWLRLGNPTVIAYSGDEAELSRLALAMTHGGPIPLLGIPSSVGLPNSPMTAYLMALPYLFSTSPLLATGFVAALNVLGVGLLGWIGWRVGGAWLAGIASLLYAVNPWAVHYSRKIWAQNFHTPLILLALALGILGFVEGRRWAQALCLPVLLIGLQIHFAAWALFPVWLAFLWIGRARLSRWVVGLSLVLGAATLLPYTLGILTQPHSPLIDKGEAWTSRALLRPPGFILWLATGTGLEQHIARTVADDFLQQVPSVGLLAILPGAAALTGLVLLWRWRRQPISGVLALWALLVPAVGLIGALPGIFSLGWLDVDAHDFIPVIPALALLSGLGWLGLTQLSTRRQGVMLGLLGLCALVGVQAAQVRGSQQYVDSHHTPTQFGFGTPIHYLLRVRDDLQGYATILIAPSADPVVDSANSPTVWHMLLYESQPQVRRWEAGATLPESFALLVPPGATAPELSSAYRLTPITTIPLRPDEGAYSILQVMLVGP